MAGELWIRVDTLTRERALEFLERLVRDPALVEQLTSGGPEERAEVFSEYGVEVSPSLLEAPLQIPVEEIETALRQVRELDYGAVEWGTALLHIWFILAPFFFSATQALEVEGENRPA